MTMHPRAGDEESSRGLSTPPPDLEELLDDLDAIAERDNASLVQERISNAKELIAEASQRGLIESRRRSLDPGDAIEGLVGSVVFASPLLVEDGVFDIANHLVNFTVVGIPIFLIINASFVVFMTYALLEWTGRNRDDSHLLFGTIPARLFVILIISFAVATVLMTVWGRVGDWQPLDETLARISVIWAVGSLGAALGDIISEQGEVPAEVLDEREGADLRQDSDASGSLPNASDDSSIDQLDDGELVAAIHEQFNTLESVVEDRQQGDVREMRERTSRA
ncbi:MAG: hypothetical protein ABEI52_13055, partial [Halobacteriaceae archaeon]